MGTTLQRLRAAGRRWLLLGVLVAVALACTACTTAMAQKRTSDARVSGVFVAPRLSEHATAEQWAASLADMRAIGVDTVVIQYSYEVDATGEGNAYFPYEGDAAEPRTPQQQGQVEAVLAGAKAQDMEVFLGLQLDEVAWFENDRYRDEAWLEEQAALSVSLAQSLWDLYGRDYGDVIAGWYLPFEFESDEEYHPYYAQLIDGYYGPASRELKADASFGEKLLMVSPLMYSHDDTTQWMEAIERLLADSAIDIIAPQDGIGFGTQDHESVETWFKVTREAVDLANEQREVPAELWINCENYVRLRDPDEEELTELLKPMAISKFVESLDLADDYADKLVTFSIHRWDTRMTEDSEVELNRPYYEAYLHFSETGLIPSGAEGYYAAIRSTDGSPVTFNDYAQAGLTNGLAEDELSWDEYRGISTENGVPFTIEVRFDDPTAVSRVSSHFLGDGEADVGLPASITYEYLRRLGSNDEEFEYVPFDEESFIEADGVVLAKGELGGPTEVDGIRLTITPRSEWTFIDDLWVE